MFNLKFSWGFQMFHREDAWQISNNVKLAFQYIPCYPAHIFDSVCVGLFYRVYQDFEGSRVPQDLLGLQALQAHLWVHILYNTITHIDCIKTVFLIELPLSTTFIHFVMCLFHCTFTTCGLIFQGKAGENGKLGPPGKMVSLHPDCSSPACQHIHRHQSPD